jgi:hypothetical protein
MEIDQLGSGLRVIIQCEATGMDNFMAFASWYSFHKNLPDASVEIACARPDEIRFDVFPWAYRLRVPVFYHRKNEMPSYDETTKPLLLASRYIMCLEPLDATMMKVFEGQMVVNADHHCFSAKNSNPAVFCSLSDGCGSFVPDKWIHKGGHPFGKADLFGRGELTVNEKRVFSVWKKLCPLYDNIV